MTAGPGDPVARSGRPASGLTTAACAAGEVGPDDLRIHPDTLRRQAEVAELHANPHLAANLRRAAELTDLADDEVLALYDALRPHRRSAAELVGMADSLAERGLPLNAEVFREAAVVYERRGLAG